MEATEGHEALRLLDERIANYSAMRDECVEAGTNENGYALATEALERVRHDLSALSLTARREEGVGCLLKRVAEALPGPLDDRDMSASAVLYRDVVAARDKEATRPPVADDPVERVLHEAQFLCDRLDNLDFSMGMDDFAREHAGHVDPSHSRLKAALAALSRPGEGS